MNTVCYNEMLENRLAELEGSDLYPFHMPGHKRRGVRNCEWDITEIDGFDNLHAPEDILKREMERAALWYGVRSTHFLVNGSTAGILTAVSAAVPRGGRLLIGRSSHISVYHAAYLRNLTVSYMEDEMHPPLAAPDAAPHAIVLTSPSYEGCVRDVDGWAEYARACGAALIVDEAHGAHFSMHPAFPVSAAEQGADLVVQSVHKTLPALTQSALLHNVSGRIPDEALLKYLRIYETSSPSYVLLSSITAALHELMDGGSGCFEEYAARLVELRKVLGRMRNLRLAGGEEAVLLRDGEIPGFPAGTRMDPGKLAVIPGGSMTSEELCRRLIAEYHLQPEMKAPSYVLLMTSLRDTEQGFRRLAGALQQLDREAGDGPDNGSESLGDARRISLYGLGAPETAMTMAEAYDAPSEAVPEALAEGRISSRFVLVFPPDAPLIVPGERFTAEILRTIRDLSEAGYTIDGGGGRSVFCVKEASAET